MVSFVSKLGRVPSSTIKGIISNGPHSKISVLARQDGYRYAVMLRHGRTEFNNENRCAGEVNIPLAKEGEEQAKKTGRVLYENNWKFDVTYCSHLFRAIQTVENIYSSIPHGHMPKKITIRHEIGERNFGKWASYTKKYALEHMGHKEYIQYLHDPNYRPEKMDASHPCHPHNPIAGPKLTNSPYNFEGESINDVAERVKPFIKRLQHDIQNGRQPLIVTHSHTGSVLLEVLQGNKILDIAKMRKLSNAVPMVMKFERDGKFLYAMPLERFFRFENNSKNFFNIPAYDSNLRSI